MKIKSWIVFSLVGFSPSLWAHGYLTSPVSRSYACNTAQNINCGAVQYEPQSLEAPSGFPEKGPADGKIASAGVDRFSNLDEQTSVRWAKTAITPGANKFTWLFTANHVTSNWRYYITQQNWDVNKPLSRSSFELTPFCTINGAMESPPATVTHSCNVPERSGYQVILAVWEVGNTANSFYNVMDVTLSGGSVAPDTSWTQQVGTIQPVIDLKRGDEVSTRVFDVSGERAELSTRLIISSDEQGEKNTWAHDLAQKVNQSNGQLRAGQKAADGTFNAIYGANGLFTNPGGTLTRVEVTVEQQGVAPSPTFSVSGMQSSYVATSGNLTLNFNVSVTGKMAIESTVYDHAQTQKGYVASSLDNSNKALTLSMKDMSDGHYMLVVKGTDDTGKVTQMTYDFMVSSDSTPSTAGQYDYTFPAGLKSYKAGTKVLQPKDNGIYQCKPAPLSGYCIQWTDVSNAYEPGVGFAWQSAWTKVG